MMYHIIFSLFTPSTLITSKHQFWGNIKVYLLYNNQYWEEGIIMSSYSLQRKYQFLKSAFFFQDDKEYNSDP